MEKKDETRIFSSRKEERIEELKYDMIEKYAKRFSKVDKKKIKTKDDFDEASKLYELLDKAMSLLAEMAGMILDKIKEADDG